MEDLFLLSALPEKNQCIPGTCQNFNVEPSRVRVGSHPKAVSHMYMPAWPGEAAFSAIRHDGEIIPRSAKHPLKLQGL
jgi:hypothetical protein